jgi:hypothetical protein
MPKTPTQESLHPLYHDLIGELERAQADYWASLELLKPLIADRPEAEKTLSLATVRSPASFVVFALPYWLGRAFGVEMALQRQVGVCSLYVLRAILDLDDIADQDAVPASLPLSVAASTLMYSEMLGRYHRLFPPDSIFWERVRVYFGEWVRSMAWERQVADDWQRGLDLDAAAGKAAPFKYGCAAIALLGGAAERLPEIERGVDLMHGLLMLIDDAFDWMKDVPAGRANTFISGLVADGLVDADDLADQEAVLKVIFTTDGVERHYRRIRSAANQALEVIARLNVPEWASLIEWTVDMAEGERERFLSTLMEPVGWLAGLLA